YDAATGRWVSEDPIRYSAGDPNLLRYVGNNPVNAVDPNGEEPEPKGSKPTPAPKPPEPMPPKPEPPAGTVPPKPKPPAGPEPTPPLMLPGTSSSPSPPNRPPKPKPPSSSTSPLEFPLTGGGMGAGSLKAQDSINNWQRELKAATEELAQARRDL